MSLNWFKWWEGAVNDMKFKCVADDTGTSVTNVIGIWAALLECACKSEDGSGSFEDFNIEIFEDYCKLEKGLVVKVLASFEKRKLIENMHIKNWEKRQVKDRVQKTDALERDEKKREQGRIRQQRFREKKQQEKYQQPVINYNECEQPKDAPLADFKCIREYYSQNIKPEGETAGEAEFKFLLCSKLPDGTPAYPGFNRIMEDLQRRVANNFWNKGFGMSLGRYLRERTWTAPLEKIDTEELSTLEKIRRGKAFIQKTEELDRKYGYLQ